MYKSVRVVQTPLPETVIWRYTDVTKLLDLVQRNALYFANLNCMQDKHERYAVPKSLAEIEGGLLKIGMSSKASEHAAKSYHERHKSMLKDYKERYFVSCWHMNDGQSAAMWKLYLSANEGVAVQSTVKRLIDSIHGAPESIFVGAVEYVGPAPFPRRSRAVRLTDLIYPAFCKRRSFEHEKELRALYLHDGKPLSGSSGGICVATNVPTLFERVYIAPTCQAWVRDVVENVLGKYGLHVPVLRSDLYNDPDVI